MLNNFCSHESASQLHNFWMSLDPPMKGAIFNSPEKPELMAPDPSDRATIHHCPSRATATLLPLIP
jgi:hypothetical protein